MNYSLILIEQHNEDYTKISGSWIQDCNAVSLEQACAMAEATERANSNRIQIAVVKKLSGANIIADPYRTNLINLRK